MWVAQTRGVFESFTPRRDAHARKRLAFSTGGSIAIYAGLALGLALFAREAKTMVDAPPIDVSFRPPPPPAPAPVVAAPVPVKRVAVPKPVAPLVAPKEMPEEKPPEADPAEAPVEVGEGTGGDPLAAGVAPAAAAPPPPPPPPPRPTRRAPINLPENATPPEAHSANAAPEYPPEARAKGLEGQVILKIVVTDQGAVTDVQVLRGEEPFRSAAIAAVQSWRYTAARIGGEPAAVYRIVKIPFRLK